MTCTTLYTLKTPPHADGLIATADATAPCRNRTGFNYTEREFNLKSYNYFLLLRWTIIIAPKHHDAVILFQTLLLILCILYIDFEIIRFDKICLTQTIHIILRGKKMYDKVQRFAYVRDYPLLIELQWLVQVLFMTAMIKWKGIAEGRRTSSALKKYFLAYSF